MIDDDAKHSLVVAAGATKVFTGYKLVTASVAPNVATVKAKTRIR